MYYSSYVIIMFLTVAGRRMRKEEGDRVEGGSGLEEDGGVELEGKLYILNCDCYNWI